MRRIAVLGYGRFGRALAELLLDAGLDVVAHDPRAEIPAERRAPSAIEAVKGADAVVLAMPVPAMRTALEAIAPALTPEQLVLDVGSVKVRPVAAMDAVLGDRIPWVGTHPLFGPTSLALAERPLRVVICPNPRHPSAATRARALYERIGCWTLEQDAAAHDKAMAETHALAFYVAKGMLDAGVDTRVPYAPPSFQAIARTVDVVRSDAGHLFAAIQAENPYARDARRRLLEALTAVDATLALDRDLPSDEITLAIPEAPAQPQSDELRETRDAIDAVDREIIALLSRRAELSRRAGKAKARIGAPVHDQAREAQVLAARRAQAEEQGLDPESIEDVFRAVLRLSRRTQA